MILESDCLFGNWHNAHGVGVEKTILHEGKAESRAGGRVGLRFSVLDGSFAGRLVSSDGCGFVVFSGTLCLMMSVSL